MNHGEASDTVTQEQVAVLLRNSRIPFHVEPSQCKYRIALPAPTPPDNNHAKRMGLMLTTRTKVLGAANHTGSLVHRMQPIALPYRNVCILPDEISKSGRCWRPSRTLPARSASPNLDYLLLKAGSPAGAACVPFGKQQERVGIVVSVTTSELPLDELKSVTLKTR